MSLLVVDSIAWESLLIDEEPTLDLEPLFFPAFFLGEEEKKLKRDDCCFGFVVSSFDLLSLAFFFAGSRTMVSSFGGDMITAGMVRRIG